MTAQARDTRERKPVPANLPSGERLRTLRREKKLSQSELGEAVGIHYTHVSRYERGVSKPSADALKKLAQVLGVSADYLMTPTAEEVAPNLMEDHDLLDLFREAQRLGPEDKMLVKKFLTAFVAKQRILAIASQ